MSRFVRATFVVALFATLGGIYSAPVHAHGFKATGSPWWGPNGASCPTGQFRKWKKANTTIWISGPEVTAASATECNLRIAGGWSHCQYGTSFNISSGTAAQSTQYKANASHVIDPNVYTYQAYSSQCSTYVALPDVSPTGIPQTSEANLGSPCPKCGNPINPATGNKFQSEVDYRGQGASSLSFQRSYNSYSKSSVGMGAGWQHNYSRSLRADYGVQQVYQQGVSAHGTDYNSSPNACQLGWLELRGRNMGLAATTALWEGGTCKIKDGTTVLGTIVLQNITYTPPANPTLLAFHAKRADGKGIRFGNSGGTFAPNADVTAKLEADGSGGYKLTDGETVEQYDSSGKLQSTTNQSGYQQLLGYDAQGRLQSVTDSFGRTLGFTYDASNRIATMTDPNAKVYTYGYDGSGNLQTVTGPDGKARTYHYEDSRFPNALTGITDENNVRFATWTYDEMGRAVTSRHAGDADITTLTYNANGTTTAQDALGASRTYTFTQANGVYKMTNETQPCVGCGTSSRSTTYDANGFVNTKTDFNGNVTDYNYNTRGLEDSRTEAYGTALARTITTQWHATLRLPTQIDEPGRRTTHTYDGSGNRLTETILDTSTSETRTTTWTYNSFGQVLTVDGPRTDVSDVTTNAYYTCSTGAQCGQVHSITNALGHVTQITSYNAHGNPLTIVDPNGVTTTLTYDLRQRLKTRTVAGATTTFDYDSVGQLDKVTMPDGSYLDYTYDAAHRLTDVEDNAGNKMHYTLDLMGNRTAEEVFDPADVLKRKQSQVFNVLGRLNEIKNSSDEVVAGYAYDAQANRTGETVYAGLFTSFETVNEFDALNRMWRSTAADGGVTQHGYNARDQLTGVTDPRSLTTNYVMNALDDLQELNSPDTGVTGYEYDAAGNRTSQVDARGVPVAYSYDVLNRLTFADYAGTAEDVTYSYDSNAQSYGKGRLTGITDAAGTTTLIYDAHGNVTQEQRVIGSSTYTTGYSYDDADRVTSITYPSGRIVTYVRNALGQVTTVATTVGGSTSTIAQDIVHMPFGGVKSYTLGNGVAVTRTYDTDYRLQNVSDEGSATIQHLAFDYDRRGNITLRDDLVASQTENFGYDEVSRLISASGAYGAQVFTYDDVGNRLTKTGTSSETYDYPTDSHRLSSLGSGATVLYDDAGNVESKGLLSLSYNEARRAATVSLGAATVANTYGANGQRATKSAAGVTTVFQYGRGGQMLAEQSDAGMLREYIWLEDMPLAQISAAGLAYIHADQLNTPQKMTDASQTVVWQASYDAFGAASVTSSGGYQNPLRFPGQYFDAETGLHQNWHRDYDPSIGRYLQSDPTGLEGGLSTYGYAFQNPLSFFDPTGLLTCTYGIAAHTLSCTNKAGQTLTTSAVESGYGQCQDNPSCETKKDEGPVPTGTYKIHPPGYSPNRPTWMYLQPSPKNPVKHRGEFFMHPGSLSLGCVTINVTTDFNQLSKWATQDGGGSLNVNP